VIKRRLNNFFFYLSLFLFVSSIYPIIFSTVSDIKNDYNKKELYNSALTELKSIDAMIGHIDGIYSTKFTLNKIDTNTYVEVVSDIVKKRFYHGLSVYSINDNWILYLAGKVFWNHLSAIVDPDDILNFPEGLCSQQVIVFLEILKRKGIQTRWVGLGYKESPGHFLAEVFYQGSWHLYDVNLEPKWDKITNQHQSMDYYILHPDTLYKTYQGILDKPTFDKIMEKVRYGDVNEFPAKNMLLLHQITKLLTYVVPVFFLFLFFWFYKKRLKSNT